MRMGLYSSGGIDWTFRPPPIATAADFLNSTPPGAITPPMPTRNGAS